MEPTSNRPGPIDDGLRDPISTCSKYLFHIVVIFFKGKGIIAHKKIMKVY